MSKTASYAAGQQDTILDALKRAIKSSGDEVFIDIVDGESLTYREIDARSNRFAHALRQLGIARGDTVVTMFDTNSDVIPSWFAINKVGAIWVPINSAYRQEFLRHQVADARAKLILCDREYLDRMVEIAGQLPEVRLILCRDRGPFPDSPIPIEPFDDYRGSDETPITADIRPGDLAALLYTSGTTGPSKGCMVSHNYFCMQGRQQRRAVLQKPGEVGWTCLPLFHSAALNLVTGALVDGLRCALSPRFSVTNFWSDIEKSRATNALVMASIFPLIAKAPDDDAMKRCYGQLKMVIGQPTTPEIRRIWQERFGVEKVSSFAYGQTEAARLTMVRHGESAPDLSAGRVADEFEMMIFDEQDRPVPDGTVGEIVFRPRQPHVMFEGYWGRPEATATVWKNLWMHTGDLGRIENGFLYFADRKKDYLRTRGENVSSFEIERTFIAHPAVMEVAIHAVGQQDAEDDIKVTVVKKSDVTVTERELCEWAIENLPHFAVPRYYEYRVELPKNPTGKVLKYQLREDGVTADTWDREEAGIVVRRRRDPS